jgi:hypothetical protein
MLYYRSNQRYRVLLLGWIEEAGKRSFSIGLLAVRLDGLLAATGYAPRRLESLFLRALRRSCALRCGGFGCGLFRRFFRLLFIDGLILRYIFEHCGEDETMSSNTAPTISDRPVYPFSSVVIFRLTVRFFFRPLLPTGHTFFSFFFRCFLGTGSTSSSSTSILSDMLSSQSSTCVCSGEVGFECVMRSSSAAARIQYPLRMRDIKKKRERARTVINIPHLALAARLLVVRVDRLRLAFTPRSLLRGRDLVFVFIFVRQEHTAFDSDAALRFRRRPDFDIGCDTAGGRSSLRRYRPRFGCVLIFVFGHQRGCGLAFRSPLEIWDEERMRRRGSRELRTFSADFTSLDAIVAFSLPVALVFALGSSSLVFADFPGTRSFSFSSSFSSTFTFTSAFAFACSSFSLSLSFLVFALLKSSLPVGFGLSFSSFFTAASVLPCAASTLGTSSSFGSGLGLNPGFVGIAACAASAILFVLPVISRVTRGAAPCIYVRKCIQHQ